MREREIKQHDVRLSTMPERNASADSFHEFWGTSKNETDTSNNAAIAALIKTQPVVHQRRNSSDTRGKI